MGKKGASVFDERNGNRSIRLPYLNYAHNQEEGNMIAFHTKLGLYYVTCKLIPANTELLVLKSDNILGNPNDNYDKAQSKLPEAELTSDLCTDNSESSTLKCRKREKRQLFADSDSVPSSSDTPDEDRQMSKRQNTVLQKRKKKSKRDSNNLPRVFIQLPPELPSYTSNYNTSDRIQHSSACESLTTSMPNCFHEKCATNHQHSYSYHSLMTRQEAFQKKVLHLMEDLRKSVQHITILLNQMIESPSELEFPENFPSLPVSSCEGLKKLNDSLENDDTFAAMSITLGSIGGRDFSDCVRRMLTKIMTNDAAKATNWKGVCGKLSFKTLHKLNSCLFASMKRNSSYSGAQQSEVENVTKKWLRNAPDREGGRAARASRTH